MSESMTEREFSDAKNIEIRPKSTTDTNATGSDSDGEKPSSHPSFPGPGADATARSPAKPHSSKLMNKLDPRYDSDILDTVQRERENGR